MLEPCTKPNPLSHAAGLGRLTVQAANLPLQAHDDEEMGLGDFLLSTVEEALASPETAAICHLILDTCSELPGWHPHLAPHHATGVLLRCAAEQPRLAPKVAAAFHMTVDALSVPDQVALLDAISGLLDASATSAAGVALLLHFGTPVQRHFHLEAVLEDLVRASGRCDASCCSRYHMGVLAAKW
jgi:hypothetical protein